MPEYVRYSDDVEQVAADEPETFRRIAELMAKGQHNVRAKVGESIRVSHAKAHGFLKGTLTVDGGLPPELAQGLFARPGSHDALVRLAQVPGEVLDDRKVSSPRGLSLKVFGAVGPKLPGHTADTQDFLLDTGKAFTVGGPKAFLASFAPNNLVAPKLPEAVKGAVSTAARAANAALHAVGLDSPKLDVYGHPRYHPLAEAYYTQVPIRYGDHIAKLGLTPANPDLKALFERTVDVPDENGLRTLTVDYFAARGATFDVAVQLCTDLATMPVEDATVEWPEDQSPYRRVGRLVLPPQDAYDPARQDFVDHRVSFAPGHALAAHRPLGGIMRARLAVYPVLSQMRHDENGRVGVEPSDLGQVPG